MCKCSMGACVSLIVLQTEQNSGQSLMTHTRQLLQVTRSFCEWVC